MRCGPGALRAAELLAILIGSGTSERSALGIAEFMLSQHEGLYGLACASVEDLKRFKGIGDARAAEIAACLELGKRLLTEGDRTRKVVRTPADVADMLMPELRHARKEHFKAVMLDTKHRILKVASISVGSLDTSVVHPRELFKEAVAVSAASVVVVHNHPSGDPTPSPEDRKVTKRLAEAGALLGIELMDHLIIGDGIWLSMKRQGMF